MNRLLSLGIFYVVLSVCFGVLALVAFNLNTMNSEGNASEFRYSTVVTV